MSSPRLAESAEYYTVTGHLKEAIRLADLARGLASRERFATAAAFAALATMHAAISSAMAATPLD